MLKIGILSFSENCHDSIVYMVDKEEGCILTGVARNEKIILLDDNFRHIDSLECLIDDSDVLIIDSACSSQMPLLKKIIRKSKHLYILNPGKFSHEDTEELLKFSNEAGIIVLFSQPHRVNPVINDIYDHVQYPTFVNIIEDGVHEEKDSLLYNKLLEKIDFLLMFVHSNIYRISACSSSDEFLNIRLEFNNAVDANITINQLADENKMWMEILSPGENIKIDLIKNEVLKINKNGKKNLLKNNNQNPNPDMAYLRKIEFKKMVESILNGEEASYNISTFHFANVMAEEVLKKISYVLT